MAWARCTRRHAARPHVAVKILPDHSSKSVELRRRFEREARANSSLSHPHICALHELGSQDGMDCLVMDSVQGETLRGRDDGLRSVYAAADAGRQFLVNLPLSESPRLDVVVNWPALIPRR